MAGKWRAFRRTLRRQTFEPDQLETSPLKRCLNYWDVTALGLGTSLGAGAFVLLGAAALQTAGPSVVLSFVIAGVAALLAGLCYAEFGARVPRAGSAYTYAHVTVGEFLAFIVGWNNILESTFATASLARGLSIFVDSAANYTKLQSSWFASAMPIAATASLARGLSMFVDTAANYTMSGWFASAMPIAGDYLSPHFDLFAFLLVIALGALLCTGARASCAVSGALAALSLATVVFVIFAGAFAANSANWQIPSEEVPAGHGVGGWFPHGAWGVLRAAAILFYAFAGFDTISATAEEVKEPRRAIPFAILSVFGVASVAYVGIAIVVTMMVPYYQQDSVSAVVVAFSLVGWEWARWIVTVGAIFGISASMLGAMYPLPRLLYCLASDGLLFRCFAHVTFWQTPVIATVVPTAVIAILAGILEVEQLILMMCVGTLLSYTVVAACVILLRYRSKIVSEAAPSTLKQIVGRGDKSPTHATSFIVHIVLLLFVCASISSALVWRLASWRVPPLVVVNALALLLLAVVALQPRAPVDLPFTTPLVPLVPLLSIYTNIHLMIFISFQTWIRVLIWILIGIPFYILFACCYKRKNENKLEENIIQASHATKNGKSAIQIVVESPTPPGTIDRNSNSAGDSIQAEDTNKDNIEMHEKLSHNDIVPYEIEEIVVQHAAVIDNNEEREAKIIDMLDKVLQAEEDSYGEILSLKKDDEDEAMSAVSEAVIHRKSFSEVSDAGSDASLGNQVLSKYDVIAQVHREDLPRVAEEKAESGEANILDNNKDNEDDDNKPDHESNDSDTNSQTDESGYSDTIDKVALNDSSEDIKETPYIPTPPPFDANFFASPNFQKSYTVPKRPSKSKPFEEPEENKPRESIQSNGSQPDGNITFGSDRQIHFMSKLNNLFQVKIATPPDNGEENRKRSNSTGNVVQNTEFSVSRDRPALFLDLKKEILGAQKLRSINTEEQAPPEVRVESDNEEEDISMSRNDLKTKLESIFANGGGQLLKPRLMKSNPPTPEEAYQTDTSSTESIAKQPKIEKNDTLKRQKDRFGAVLNSFRLSLNKDDVV